MCVCVGVGVTEGGREGGREVGREGTREGGKESGSDREGGREEQAEKKKRRIEIGNMDRVLYMRELKGGDEFLVSPHPGGVIAGPNNLVPRTGLMPVNIE